MKRTMLMVTVLVGFLISVTAAAYQPGLEMPVKVGDLKVAPAKTLPMVNCLQHPILFSTDATKYGVSVVVGAGTYTVHWWGKLSCGTYDSLVALSADNTVAGGVFTAGGKLFPVFVSSQLPPSLKVQKVDKCEGLAKDKSVVHCSRAEADTINQDKLHSLQQTLSTSSQKFAFYAPTKASPTPTDFVSSPEVVLPTLLEQGKELDGDNDGIYTAFDNCPTVFNPNQDDACPAPVEPPQDGDHDGVPDSSDTCPGQGEAGKVDANGCPLSDESGGTVTPPDATEPEAGTTAADTATTTAEDSGGFCALMPSAAPNAGWLLALVGMIPLVVRRRR